MRSTSSPLAFDITNPNNICSIISNVEPFFGYLLSGIKIEVGDYVGFEYAACTSTYIKVQRKYLDTVKEDKSKLKEFITLMLHEIYHIYLNHYWRFGFYKDGLYNKYRDKAKYLKTIINIVLDAVINTNLRLSNYEFGTLGGYFVDTILEKNNPRANDNNWNEEELLAYILSNSKYDEESQTVELPSGEKIDLNNIELDLIEGDGDGNEIRVDTSEKFKELADKAGNYIRSSGKQQGSLSQKLTPNEDIRVAKSNDLSWQDRLKQLALTCINNSYAINYDSVKEENFYPFEMGLSSFNLCPVEYNYKPKPKPDTIAVYVDLSGSIFYCPDTISLFLGQISEIAEAIGNLLLITFDDGITGSYMFNMSELSEPLGDLLLRDKETYLVGGGGTDVIPLFEAFFDSYSKTNIDVDINNICMVIVLTDLYLTPVNKSLEPTNSKGVIPTIWVVPEQDYNDSIKVNFGEILVIKEDK